MPMNLGQIGLGLGAQGNNSWFNAVEFQDLSAVADFNNDRYALPALGAELITNGDFSSASGWTDASTPSSSFTISGGYATANVVGGQTARLRQTVTVEPGKLYRVSRAASGTGSSCQFSLSSTSGYTGDLLTQGANAERYVLATTSSFFFNFTTANNGDTVDDVSVREVILTRGGQALGANLGANGYTMSVNGGTGTATESPTGQLNLTGDGTNAATADKSFTCVVGRKYRIMFNLSGGNLTVAVGATQGSTSVMSVNTTAAGFQTMEFTAASTTTWIRFFKLTATLATATAIEIRELPATGAYPKRSATRDEWLAFTATSTTERSYVGVDGLYKNNLTANTLRFDWRNGKRQLRLEDARTNSIRNNSMVGAVAGTPGTIPTNWNTSTPIVGLTRSIVGTGVEFGLPYIDVRLAGTPDIASYYNISFENGSTAGGGIAASSGQTWTLSYRARLVAGSTANLTSVTANINENTSAGGFVVGGAGTGVSLDSSIKVVTYTRTLSGGGTVAIANPLLNISTVAGGVPVDITIRIYAPQMEQGFFASDPILTTSAAVTRAIETARFSPLLEAVLQRAAASVVVRGRLDYFTGDTYSTSQRLISGINPDAPITTGFNSRRMGSWNGTTFLGNSSDAPTPVTEPFGAVWAADSAGRSFAVAGTVASDTEPKSAYDLTQVYLARPNTTPSNNPSYAAGLYDFVGVSPERLSNATLQALAVAAV